MVADLSGGMRALVYVEIYISGEREDFPEAKIVLNTIANILIKA